MATPADPTARDEPAPAATHDPSRRRFFREFAGELAGAAAQVVGAAQVLQRESAEAAQAILAGTELAGPADPTATTPPPPTGFRSAFRMDGDRILFVDQRRLPHELVEHPSETAPQVAHAIKEMIVRGAPAMGQAAALGLALTANRVRGASPYARRASLRGAANALINARPTAVNVRWAVERVMARYEEIGDLSTDGAAIADAMRAEAEAIVFEATDDHGRLAEFGLAELPETPDRALRLLTHCNTGPLACGQFGTALGIVQAAHHRGRALHVHVDETRPYLQGARLTAWELGQAGVPYTLVADGAAGWLMSRGIVDAVLVGADRIAANGDTANKIGTYPLAVLAARHEVPFFVCAPTSSVDLATADGASIPIEERSSREVLEVAGRRIAPPEATALNPAFDVTPAELITAIVTEEGALRAPFASSLAEAVASRAARRTAQPSPLTPHGAGG